MTILNAQELSLLEKNPETASIAKKLKEDSWIPKEKMDEALHKQRELSDKLNLIEAEKQSYLTKVQEFETQFKTEKSVADEFRQYVKERKSGYKTQFGELWLPEYESETFSLTSLEKVAGTLLKGAPPGTITTPPGKQPAPKKLSEMSPEERETAIANAKK